MAAIAAVLSMYDMELIREVTDPRTGICATEKFSSFMPNAGELKVYCDAVATRKANLARLAALPKPDFSRTQLAKPSPKPGDLANAFVPTTHGRYQEFVEWAKGADERLWRYGKSPDGRDGIFVVHEAITDRKVTMPTLGQAAKKIADDAA